MVFNDTPSFSLSSDLVDIRGRDIGAISRRSESQKVYLGCLGEVDCYSVRNYSGINKVTSMNWIERFIGKQIAKRVRKELEMTGWKSKVSGVGAILGGLALIIKGITGDSFDWNSIQNGFAGIVGGFGILGIAHKIEKAGKGED